MNIALVHDSLLRFGGAERVLQELHALYPEAPIFTVMADRVLVREHFGSADVRTSFLDRVPGLKRFHRLSLPLLPFAVESFDLRDYDVVLSSASGFTKGLITRAHTQHICYCHTPPRFLWEDRDASLAAHAPRSLRPFAAMALHGLRLWDQHAAQRVDYFLANSVYTKARIRRYYHKDALVVPPPVDLTTHPTQQKTRQRFSLPDEFFLYVGHLAWWKRVELAVETFNRLGLQLVVVGSGPLERRLLRRARGNIRFLGWQDDATVRELMAAARALVHPQTEDFGITAVEAMAEGTPVVAFRHGGAVETVQEGISGEFFEDADPIAFADAVRRLRERAYDPVRIRASVAQYAPEHFREAIQRAVELASRQAPNA